MDPFIHLKVGKLKTNCYIFIRGNEVVIIDPGDDGPAIKRKIETKIQKAFVKILLTHGHADQILAVEYLSSQFFNCMVYASESENLLLFDSEMNLSQQMGLDITLKNVSENIKYIGTGDEITCGDLIFRVVETPGHTPGSVIYILDQEKMVFTGDLLFKGNVGMTYLFILNSHMVMRKNFWNPLKEKFFH